MTDPSKIRARNWQQGSALPDALCEQLCIGSWNAHTALIVLTQDCDLVHSSYAAEPDVELIRGAFVGAADHGLRYARNPRRLHLDVTRVGKPAVLDFTVHHRIVAPRQILEEHGPLESILLGPDERRILCEWVAKRYVRAAFPDAFNERAATAHRKIEKELKRSGEHVTGLFLMIDPDTECTTGESYRVLLRITARSAALANQGTEIELARLTKSIAAALSACDGILVEDDQLVSEAHFTLEDLRYFKRWDWDYRSHSGEPGGEVVPTR